MRARAFALTKTVALTAPHLKSPSPTGMGLRLLLYSSPGWDSLDSVSFYPSVLVSHPTLSASCDSEHVLLSAATVTPDHGS